MFSLVYESKIVKLIEAENRMLTPSGSGNYLSIFQIIKDLPFCSVPYRLEDKSINLLVSGSLPRLFETKSLLLHIVQS